MQLPHGGVSAATPGGRGLGGGLYITDGAVEITDVRFLDNSGWGGQGGNGSPGVGDGGVGAGGGLYAVSGHVQLSGVTLTDNSARGGNRGNGNGGTGGNGNGGGLVAAGGTITALDSYATGNSAQGGNGGQGTGGGLFIGVTSSVGLNAFTAAHIANNTASTSDPNIYGLFDIIPDLNALPGDYNQNGIVDAADYTVWRDNLGSGTSLANDDTPGVGQDDYDRWVLHFGEMAGSGGSAAIHLAPGDSPGANYAIPEPSSFALAAIGLLCLIACTWGGGAGRRGQK
jgi:hypothetical protein